MQCDKCVYKVRCGGSDFLGDCNSFSTSLKLDITLSSYEAFKLISLIDYEINNSNSIILNSDDKKEVNFYRKEIEIYSSILGKIEGYND